jgi:acetyl-CoA carboxylase / biotin carboxylase 1
MHRLNIEGTNSIVTPGSFMRTGCMAAFQSFEHFKEYSDEILDLLEDFASPAFVSSKVLEAVEAADSESRRMSTSINVSMSDPITRACEIEQSK